MDGEWLGALAILMVFGIPIVAILSKPIQQALAQRERREARQLYERLTMEKLDVIKTAVAIGMKDDGLADLDMRLERVIGTDQMKSLLLAKDPHVPGEDDLLDSLDDLAPRRSRRRERE